MGKQLFIPKTMPLNNGEATPGAVKVSDMTEGQAGFLIEGKDALVPQESAGGETLISELTDEKLQIAWKNSSGNIEMSPSFTLEDIKENITIEYSAGTAQVITVTPTLPDVQEEGDEYLLKILDTSKGTANPEIKRFSVYHQGTDYDLATLLTALADKVNEDTELELVAANSGDSALTLTTTDETFTKYFRVAVDAELRNANIAYTTNNIPAQGKPVQIADLEQRYNPDGRGLYNERILPRAYKSSEVDTSKSYNTYVLNMLYEKPAKHRMNAVNAEEFKAVISIPNDATLTTITDFLALL